MGAIGLDKLGLTRNDRDAESSDWETESFANEADLQLKQIGKLLTSLKEIDAQQVAALLDKSFFCTRLRPKDLHTIYDGPALHVVRPSADASQDSDGMRGAEGFAMALRELVEPHRDGQDRRVKFKIFHVDLKAQGATTKSHFQLCGTHERTTTQQNALWHCQWRFAKNGKPLLTSIRVEQYEQSVGRGSEGPLFADCTEAVLNKTVGYRDQLSYSLDHWLDRIERRFDVDASGWEGLAVGDVNGDGLDDLYVCQPGGLPNRLFIQQADGTAIETARAAGVDWLEQTRSALFVDLDNDGDQDLVVGTSWGVIFMTGSGTGQFKVVMAKLLPEGPPFSLSAADFDGDGDLDIFVCGYAVRRRELSEVAMGRPVPYHDANNGARNVLLRNDLFWRFRDVTESIGLGQNNRRFSFAASWEDYDNDGDLDLYVANDYGRNNLYRFDKEKKRFEDVAPTAGVEDISAGMSVSWSDYDNDGLMDLYISNMWSSAGNRIAFQRRFQKNASSDLRADYQRHARGNSLFKNTGNGNFLDQSVSSGVTMGRWAWGSLFADINNDGLDDLLVANGYLTQDDNNDL